MPQSLSAVYLHLVFSTKDRRPFLSGLEVRKICHSQLMEISKRMDCSALIVDGVEDHVHILAGLGRTISQSEWVKEMKRVSSMNLKEHVPEFSWKGGYGIFSVDADNVQPVYQYIQNQEAHHRKISFKEEYLKLLEEHGLKWDERYLWD